VEDSFEGEITHKGHGLQRALIVTLLQHLAMTVPVEPTSEGSADEEAPITEPKGVESLRGPDLILAIEEPELYLHPSRCRYLSSLLVQLTEKPEFGLGASNQIMYTSHSPYFVHLRYFDQIRMVRKESSSDSPVPQSVVKRFFLNEAKNKMAEICGRNPDDFTRDSFKARAMSVMNTIVNEGYFADVVVVVEGPSDVGALWKLQEIMNKNWSGLGIAVVPAGGKNNIDRPTVIFRGLSIPTYFIFDADSHLIGKDGENGAKDRNQRYLKLAGVSPEDFPDTQVHETWAVIKKNLEKLVEEELDSKIFQSLQATVASEFGYDDAARVNKNIDGITRLIELAYEGSHRIPTLEKIVEMVTQLHCG
jgi:predicted ATP-dependent endonuclease of OLD family